MCYNLCTQNLKNLQVRLPCHTFGALRPCGMVMKLAIRGAFCVVGTRLVETKLPATQSVERFSLLQGNRRETETWLTPPTFFKPCLGVDSPFFSARFFQKPASSYGFLVVFLKDPDPWKPRLSDVSHLPHGTCQTSYQVVGPFRRSQTAGAAGAASA